MIRRLRRKFILIAALSIMFVLIFVISIINAALYVSNIYESQAILDFLSNNYGMMIVSRHNDELNFRHSAELPYEIRYFTMLADENGSLIFADYAHISAVNKDNENTVYQVVRNAERSDGRLKIGNSIYLYKKRVVTGAELIKAYSVADTIESELPFRSNGIYDLVVFLDYSTRDLRLYNLRLYSIYAAIACFVIFLFVISVFSKHAIQPFVENSEKQKTFITNAGHELKTPIAIISANTEVMEAMDGPNEWTQSNMAQVERLTRLVNELVTLARLEEAAEKETLILEEVDLSEKAAAVSQEFHGLAVTNGLTLETNIAEGIKVKGQEKSLHELISILLDNAVKYCDEGGHISVTLERKKKNAVFIVANSYKNGADVDYSRFFERFYREDSSHSQIKSGYGIGLSMAESIVRAHKGSISVSYKNGDIIFRVLL